MHALWAAHNMVPTGTEPCSIPDSFVARFDATVSELMERISSGLQLVVQFESALSGQVVARALVPLAPLLSETWVQGNAKIWSSGTARKS